MGPLRERAVHAFRVCWWIEIKILSIHISATKPLSTP
jgi:hypothetical protein